MMIGFALAAILNDPKIVSRRDGIAAHAASPLSIALLIFSAGVFTATLEGTATVDLLLFSRDAIPDSLVCTRDVAKGLDIANRLQTGIAHINGPTVRDEAQMPLGGAKALGCGILGTWPRLTSCVGPDSAE